VHRDFAPEYFGGNDDILRKVLGSPPPIMSSPVCLADAYSRSAAVARIAQESVKSG